MKLSMRTLGPFSIERLVLALLSLAMTVPIATAQYADRLANDISLPLMDPAAVATGAERFGALCSICHGAKGNGRGKGAPCLTCGRFRHGGKASELYAHISGGIKGSLMGGFGSSLQHDEILSIIAFIRVHTANRRAGGEID